MKRNIDKHLLDWKRHERKKPLLLRGARQIGKTFAVRQLGKTFKYYLEVNFEQHEESIAFFEGNFDIERICERLSITYNTPIIEGKTLLFFDEIQACPRAIQSLRYFYENKAKLHIIGAGSLLEFALQELASFGVGRIRSMFMFPMSFEEYMIAAEEQALWNIIKHKRDFSPIEEAYHNKALEHLYRFILIGGMPEAVKTYLETGSLMETLMIHNDIITAMTTDFSKYRKRIPAVRMQEVCQNALKMSGRKLTYSETGQDISIKQAKNTYSLLNKAGLFINITHSNGNGIPLGAESNSSKIKPLFFDTGLMQSMLKLDTTYNLTPPDFNYINKGNVAEVFVGNELVKNSSPYTYPELFYWQREKKGSQAELDYLLTIKDKIVPLEVKSGTKGAMQSMMLYLKEKNKAYGIRTSLENFSDKGQYKTTPLYAAGNLIEADKLEGKTDI